MAKKSSSLWYPRYSGDYQRKTSHLSLVEHGAYSVLMDHYYATGKPLPANADVLRRVCRAFTPAEVAAMESVLEQFFELIDSRYHNDRADEEISRRSDISTKRKKAQQAGVEKKHRNAAAKTPAIENTVTVTVTDAEEEKTDTPVSVKKGARGTRLQADFKMPTEWLAEAYALGAHGVLINEQAARFKDHWLGAPGQRGVKLDWLATWRNWIRKAVQDDRTRPQFAKPTHDERRRTALDAVAAVFTGQDRDRPPPGMDDPRSAASGPVIDGADARDLFGRAKAGTGEPDGIGRGGRSDS